MATLETSYYRGHLLSPVTLDWIHSNQIINSIHWPVGRDYLDLSATVTVTKVEEEIRCDLLTKSHPTSIRRRRPRRNCGLRRNLRLRKRPLRATPTFNNQQ